MSGSSASDNSAKPDPIPYADRSLPTAGVVYQQMAFPSDWAGFWNPARFVEDPTNLRLEPGPLHRSIGVFVGGALTLGAMFIAARGGFRSPNGFPVFQVSVCGLLFLLLFIFPAICAIRRRQRTPWIAVDRERRVISLPRAPKSVPYSSVVRLQLVSFARVGWSSRTWSYHGEPYSGELQIVFRNGAREETWCVVSWPAAHVLKRFVVAFREASGIPVSRVTQRVGGEIVVEAFDGE